MTPHDRDPLDALVPALPWSPDWSDVLARARPPARRTQRRLVLALALVAAVAVPLVAYGSKSDWWFLSSGSPPATNAPVVVKEGEWSGHAWKLVAYLSSTDGLCVSLTPTGAEPAGEGAAMGCGPIAGVPRTEETKRTPDMTITYLMAAASRTFPGYVVGPVVDRATQVEIRFAGGRTMRLATFAGVPSLGSVRFYASELPAGVVPGPGHELVEELRGLNASGAVVACLVPRTAVDGVSPLADCG
jgi:hypothetical protein